MQQLFQGQQNLNGQMFYNQVRSLRINLDQIELRGAASIQERARVIGEHIASMNQEIGQNQDAKFRRMSEDNHMNHQLKQLQELCSPTAKSEHNQIDSVSILSASSLQSNEDENVKQVIVSMDEY